MPDALPRYFTTPETDRVIYDRESGGQRAAVLIPDLAATSEKCADWTSLLVAALNRTASKSPPLDALGWILCLAASRFTENADGADPAGEKAELQDLLAVVAWLEAAGLNVGALEEIRGCLPNDDLAAKILAWEPPPPDPDPLAALRAAESFLSGFEDDCTQESLPATLASVRAAIEKLEG